MPIPRFVSVAILFFFIISIKPPNTYAQGERESGFKVNLSIESRTGSPDAVLIIKCTTEIPFTDGEISLKLSRRSVDIPIANADSSILHDRTILWTGKSNSYFAKEFRFPFTLPMGEKSFFNVTFKGKGKSGYSDMGFSELYMHNTADGGIQTSWAGYNHLQHVEIDNEVKRKGLEGLNRGQMYKRDPELAKKIDTMGSQPEWWTKPTKKKVRKPH